MLRLEDPIEDLFCDRISTVRGDFRIFFGVWECAGAYTQTLLDAFESLPAGGLKDQALEAVYALLQLSEAVAERAGVDRSTTSSGPLCLTPLMSFNSKQTYCPRAASRPRYALSTAIAGSITAAGKSGWGGRAGRWRPRTGAASIRSTSSFAESQASRSIR